MRTESTAYCEKGAQRGDEVTTITITGADTQLLRNLCSISLEAFIEGGFDEMDYHFSEARYGVACLISIKNQCGEISCKIKI